MLRFLINQIDYIHHTMNNIDINKMDLNLIKAFDALMTHGNVTKAADALGLGQPAVSHALGRLRDLFGDQLFVRTPTGMVPTDRANECILPIRRALSELEAAFGSKPEFDARAQAFQLTIGLSDYTEAVLLPGLLRIFEDQAPNAFLKVRQIDLHRMSSDLDSGKIDLAITSNRSTKSWHLSEVVFSDHHCCIYSKPLIGTRAPISLAKYVSHRHVTRKLGRTNTTSVDDELTRRGMSRQIVASVPRFSIIPELVSSLAVIATVPIGLIKTFDLGDDIAVSRLPIDLDHFDISMHWHATQSNNPALEWLRFAIQDLGANL